MPTKSEALFDHYCNLRDYQSEPIEAGGGLGKTPDRVVSTPFGQLIAEIKELTPNDEDKRQIEELKQQGWTTGGGRPGARTFSVIKRAAPQLKRFADRGLPCVLVLFDNIVIDGMRPRAGCIHLESSFIDFGMYGLQAVHLSPESPEPGSRLVQVADGRGGRRQMTDDARVYIGALAVLYEHPETSEPLLYVYHNYFAEVPLSPQIFRGPHDRHFRKTRHPDESPQEWQDVASPGAG